MLFSLSTRSVKPLRLVIGITTLICIAFILTRTRKKHKQVKYISSNIDDCTSDSIKEEALKREIIEAGNIPLSALKEITNVTNLQIPEDEIVLNLVKDCSNRPKLVGLEFSNTFWQMISNRLEESNSTDIYAYGAYMDTRLEEDVKIRILVDSYNYLDNKIQKPNFCQIWFTGAIDPFISSVTEIIYIGDSWDTNGLHQVYLITCNLPQLFNESSRNVTTSPWEIVSPKNVPESVSLVMNKCDTATNNLKLNYIVPTKKEDFGVCVRWLDYPTEDLSLRIIEWIEILRILGAAKIHFKILAVHPNVFKVLKFYEREGHVTVQNFSYPGFQPNFPQIRNNYSSYMPNHKGKTWRQERIVSNDCFYTYMYSYKYIISIDINEIIIPVTSNHWKTMIERLKLPKTISPCFKVAVFTDYFVGLGNPSVESGKKDMSIRPLNKTDVSYDPHMMTKLHTVPKCYPKNERICFYDTRNMISIAQMVSPNSVRKCIKKPCTGVVDYNIAYDHRYSTSCNLSRLTGKDEKGFLKNPYEYHPSILKFKNKLVSQRDNVLKNIG